MVQSLILLDEQEFKCLKMKVTCFKMLNLHELLAPYHKINCEGQKKGNLDLQNSDYSLLAYLEY